MIAITGWPQHGMIPPPQKRFHNQWHRKFYCTECFFLYPPTVGNAHTGLVFCSDTHPHLIPCSISDKTSHLIPCSISDKTSLLIPCSISDKNQRYLPLLGTVLASPSLPKEKMKRDMRKNQHNIFNNFPLNIPTQCFCMGNKKSSNICHIATAHTYYEQDLNKQPNKTTQHSNVCTLTQVIAKQPHKLNHYSLNSLLWHSFSQFTLDKSK